MLFTLTIYQCRMERGENGTSVSGGRTRLHLFDLGCGRYSHQASGVPTTMRLGNKYSKRTSKHEKCHSKTNRSSEDSFMETDDFDRGTTGTHISTKCLSISGMANVLLALLTGQRYLPFRDSALTHLLKEAMTGNQMHPCIVAHIASGAQYYTETLQVIQLVSKLSRLRRRRVGSSASAANTLNSSLTSDQQTPAGSRDEAGSSSVDGFSESGRSNRCYRRFRGPRLGRSSYYSRSVASFSSELDFTSSSEQSCDTVIYLGQSVQAHRTRSVRPANPLLSKLGPRGAADGSVDARSASSGHLSAGEATNVPHSVSGQTKQFSTSTGETINTGHGFGLVKRMTPRTNATVWPRTFSLRRAKEVFQSQQETWVDGPKAMSVPVSPPAVVKSSGRVLSPSCSEQELTQLLPMITVSKPSTTHSSVQLLSVKTSMSWDKEHFQDQFGGLTTKPTFGLTAVRLPNTLVNSEHVQASHTNRDLGNTDNHQLLETVTFSPLAWQAKNGIELAMDNVLHTVPTCDYTVLDHDSKHGPRALSDISERTEDTETFELGDSLISHAKYGYRTLNDETNEIRSPGCRPETDDIILNLRRQIWAASAIQSDASSHVRTHRNTRSNYSKEDSISPVNSTLLPDFHEVTEKDLLSTQIPSGIKQLGYSPLKLLHDGFNKPNAVVDVTDESYINVCGDETVTVDTFEKTVLGTQPPSLLDPSSLSKQRLIACSYQSPAGCLELRSNVRRDSLTRNRDINRKAHSPSPSRPQCSTLSSNPQHSLTHSTNSSLLRVAAWVNSIETVVTPQLNSRPTTASEVDYGHSLESSANKSNAVIERKTSPVTCCHTGREEKYAKLDLGNTFPSILSNVTARIPLPSVTLEFDRPVAHSSKGKLSFEQSEHGTFNVCGTPTSTGRSGIHPNFLLPYKPGHKESIHCIPSSTNNSNPYAVPLSAPKEYRSYIGHKVQGGANSTASFGVEILMPQTIYSSMNSDVIQPCQSYIQPNVIYTTVNCSLQPTPTNVTKNSEVNPTHFKPMGVESQKGKNQKSNGRFRFLTLPLFRSLRLRKEKKAKMKKPIDGDCIVQSPVASTVPHLFSERTHSFMHPPISPCIQMPVMHSVNFDPPLGNNLVMHPNSTSTPRRSSVAEDNQRTKREPLLMWDKDFQCNTHYSAQKLENLVSNNGTKPRCPGEHMHFQGQQRPKNICQFDENIDHFHAGLANGAPTQLNVLNYTPGLFATGAYRSGRRSVTGGPASSGYDSMHIGTSELSLSHPDSASECSALAAIVPSQVNKESSKVRPSNEVQWLRRNSSAAISHTSGSVGSLTSNSSPMHPKTNASHNPMQPDMAKLTTPMTHLHVSSFLGLQSQNR
ncbi:hypothetical protein EG68_10105 [Paragonimus skrjabini miyazakii]|uniref:Kinesin motor domain-containing protein n=1 Tax=Paragonimus skrjabini miyazakii TaxID=59628 RepID=A0A8S9YFR8_9TREM|nr:hypothetical protein EG68_10105 [Paragonimus skrjabini miyazakii]